MHRPLGFTFLTILLVLLGFFFWVSFTQLHHRPLFWTVFPFVIWAALRFGQPGTTATVLVASGMIIWMTAQGGGPLAGTTLREGLPLLQLFTGVLSVTGLVLAAVMSERQRAKTTLLESEERFHALIERSHDAIALIDAAGTIVYASTSTSRIHGCPVQVGRPAIELVHPDDREPLLKQLADLIRQPGHVATAEYRVQHVDGSWRWVEGAGTNLLADARVRAVVANYRDITERKQVEQALRRAHAELERRMQERMAAEARFRALFEGAPTGIMITDVRGRIVSANAQMEKMFGYGRGELLGRSAETLVPERFHNAHVGYRAGYEADPQIRAMGGGRDLTALRKDGTELPVEIGLSPVRTENAALVAAHITDITARKQTEAALRRVHDELEHRVLERTAELRATNQALRAAERRMAELSNRLLTLQDEERRRIGRELHDSTAQNLAGVAMNLAVVQRLAMGLNERAQKALADSVALLDQCAREIRTISYLLHPPLLDEAGLASAVRWYADGFAKRSGIHIDVEVSPDLGRLPQEIETALFRIVQECLTNVHRHAGGSTVRVQIARALNAISLKVQDSGQGMAAEILKAVANPDVRIGVGIMGMHERMRQLGGQLDISSSEHGTAVEATLPFVKPTQQSHGSEPNSDASA